ncbi:adenosylcobinamide-GDP ribazoletransferase, partial [Sphingorhabdus sp.]|uniref:adenosylcobinamide-GDP ribazoletransferase n=1 Tax=Sphingorhabdus sp. TaxID=1902408 RepID=UPI003593BDB9
MAFPRQLHGLMRALAFLTRVPMPDEAFEGGLRQTAEDAALFPLAGLVAAVPGALVLLITVWMDGGPLLAAALAIVATIVITGALHEDGFADVADGFGGGHTSERRLAIMKDSANGTYGTLALVVSVVLRFAALAAL